MLNEMLGIGGCPVCGRDNYYEPLPGHWCTYCGGGDTTKMKLQIQYLNEQLTNIQNIDIKNLDSRVTDIEETLEQPVVIDGNWYS